jgi:pimeloyl-ACP methyl ester carboxylesterase
MLAFWQSTKRRLILERVEIASLSNAYDPFIRGPFPVGVRTIQALDESRNRLFPCEVWYPAAAQHDGQDLTRETQDCFIAPLGNTVRCQSAVRDAVPRMGTSPLVVFSHPSGAGRRSATFLCTHLSSHGYIVAALDHSEIVAPELARKVDETAEQKCARWDALIASRVPDVIFLLNHLLGRATLFDGVSEKDAATIDPTRIGIVGHSFGGWTALAAPETEQRIGALVALAPGGSSHPKPGILPVKLNFKWARDVPTLFLVAENDVSLPLAGMYELFERTPATKRMFILRRADHMHFMDDVEAMHEAVRTTPWPGELAWMPKEMLRIEELCSGEQAHLFVRGLTLSHLDAVLKREERAQQFLEGDVEGELGRRNVSGKKA